MFKWLKNFSHFNGKGECLPLLTISPFWSHQQHLTEELQTVENGYHDNPTLEVMEVQPEMQEKKMALNGEFNDSWIVPMDNLMKEDMPDEEDTHL